MSLKLQIILHSLFFLELSDFQVSGAENKLNKFYIDPSLQMWNVPLKLWWENQACNYGENRVCLWSWNFIDSTSWIFWTVKVFMPGSKKTNVLWDYALHLWSSSLKLWWKKPNLCLWGNMRWRAEMNQRLEILFSKISVHQNSKPINRPTNFQ